MIAMRLRLAALLAPMLGLAGTGSAWIWASVSASVGSLLPDFLVSIEATNSRSPGSSSAVKDFMVSPSNSTVTRRCW